MNDDLDYIDLHLENYCGIEFDQEETTEGIAVYGRDVEADRLVMIVELNNDIKISSIYIDEDTWTITLDGKQIELSEMPGPEEWNHTIKVITETQTVKLAKKP